MNILCGIGGRLSDLAVIYPCLLQMIVAIIMYGAFNQSPVYASDLDVPAYMIYVDPVTGKYTTKPPAEQGEGVSSASGNTDTYGPANNNVPGQTESSITPNNRQNLRAPATATLLLVGLGLVSLLFKGRQIS